MQLVSSVGSIAETSSSVGGVAYMAHVGGFIAGASAAIVCRMQMREEPDTVLMPGGESLRQVLDRSWQGLTRASEGLGDSDTLLVVAHDAVNRVLLNHVMNLPWQGAVSIEQDPACFNIIDVDRNGDGVDHFLVRAVNVTAYNLTKAGINLTDMERAAQRDAERLLA